MPASSSIGAIILAAGSSSRMGAGRHKLLLPLGEHSVLVHVINATLASQARPIILVLGHQVEQVRAHIAAHIVSPDIISIENPAYLQGMSTSLRVGLQALIHHQNMREPAFNSPTGAIIMLGDQPLMTPHIIDALIASRHNTGKHIVAPLYNGRRGNPVLFASSLFPALMAISGDEGARSVIEQHKSELATIELNNPEAGYDVDTWEAYQQVVDEWERQQKQYNKE